MQNEKLKAQEALEIIENTLPFSSSLAKEANPNAKIKSTRKTSSDMNSSRDEMNLAEFPLAVLSTRTNPSIKTLEFCDNLRLKTGEVIERKWLITGADKFGLPTSTDDDVLLGLMRLSMDQEFRDRKIYFTRYELLKILRWTTEGRSYSRLTKSLDRLSGVRIRSTNAFYDNSLKAYQTCNFGIIDAYEINDSRGNKIDRVEQPKSFFIWSEVIFDSFNAGFIKKLDLDLYFSLQSAVSRRLYRYLDKHFYYRSVIEKPLVEFAFEKLGLSRTYKYVSSIKQQIEPALKELTQMGFLASYEYSREGQNTVIKFISGDQHGPTPIAPIAYNKTSATQSDAVDPKKTSFVEALVSRGISLGQARRLLDKKTETDLAQIDSILRYYDHLVETGDHKVSKNRVGFLYRAVESPFKFIVPKAFQTSFDMRSQETPKFPNSKRNIRMRPELKVFSTAAQADKNAIKNTEQHVHSTTEEAMQSQYYAFVENELIKNAHMISSEKVSALHSLVEERLKGLRSVLKEDRLQKIFEGCFKEELKKLCNIPDFEQWKKNR